MKIEFMSGERAERVLVTMEAAELDGYGITFSTMSLYDPHTRAMLRDLLSMVTRMGLRREGEQVRVDCVQTDRGGCALLISGVPEPEYHFDSSDDIIAAHLACGMPEGELRQIGKDWVFRPCGVLTADQRLVLLQFCRAVRTGEDQ